MWLVLFVSAVAVLSLVFVANLKPKTNRIIQIVFSPVNDLREWQ